MKMVVLFLLLLLLFSLLPSLSFRVITTTCCDTISFFLPFSKPCPTDIISRTQLLFFCSDCKDWSITLPPLPPPLNFFSWSHLIFPSFTSFIITDSPSGLLFPVHQLNYHHLLLLLSFTLILYISPVLSCCHCPK